MARPDNIQIGSLDFDSIKSSIIDHLKTQDTLKDYDYTGSVAQVLLDVLAYNTLYYGFYTNMVANEMFLDTAQKTESLISLVKPLGFVVPGKISSRATIKIKKNDCDPANSFIPKYTRFSGNNSQGIAYNFYNTESQFLDSDCESVISVVEGKQIFKEIPLVVDHNTKKGFINGLDIDISTIVVEVYDTDIDPSTGTDIGWVYWSRASNTESYLDDQSLVYWLERSEYGFFIVFGGAYGDAVFTQVGKRITKNDRIRISYLKTNGSGGNGISGFSTNDITGTTTTIALSSGGVDEPNLDAIRFYAPKWFASQDRAVTVEDCRAFLVNAGFVDSSDGSNPYSRFNVWGGEQMSPPRYGRVFVSLSDDYEGNYDSQATVISILKEKTCVSILPEFLEYKSYEVSLRGTVQYNPMLTSLSQTNLLGMINENIHSSYPNTFEQSISISTLMNKINSVDPSLQANQADFILTISTDVPIVNTKTATHHFKNPCEPGTLYSNDFVAHSSINVETNDRKIRLQTSGEVVGGEEGYQDIVAYYWQSSIPIVVAKAGRFQPSTGLIEINPNVSSEAFKIYAVPKMGSFKASENMFTKLGTVELTLTTI